MFLSDPVIKQAERGLILAWKQNYYGNNNNKNKF